MTVINARNLTLNDVYRILKIQKLPNGSLPSLLSLEPLTELEEQELLQIRDDFDNYLSAGKVSEGLVKALTTFPLLRLAGFYRYPLQISLEEGIADINITDEDRVITGRLDVLVVNQATPTTADFAFWVLVIEAKNSEVDVSAGLPQLLTYAYKSLESQESVWGLTTNGARYQFVYIQQGTPPTYQLMPFLNLMDSEPAIQILQVLKAIAKLPSNSAV